jgi:hypothetical protein
VLPAVRFLVDAAAAAPHSPAALVPAGASGSPMAHEHPSQAGVPLRPVTQRVGWVVELFERQAERRAGSRTAPRSLA